MRVPTVSPAAALIVLDSTPNLTAALVGRVMHSSRVDFLNLADAYAALAPTVDIRRAVGKEALVWPNGSRLIALSSGMPNATRGLTLDAVVLTAGLTEADLPFDWTPSFLTSRWPA